MANPWFRLWGDMVNDPKWRTIARKSGQRIGDVIAIAIHMMTHASNAEDRGRLEGWNDEDIATALDLDAEQVEAVREAMQGRTLDGDRLTGWEKRQPKRERESDDTAADRKRQQRAREAEKGNVTPSHATSHQEKPREEEIREEEIRDIKAKASAAPKKTRAQAKTLLPNGFCISDRVTAWAAEKGYSNLQAHFENFTSACRAKGYAYADWDEGFMGAIRNDWAKVNGNPRASPANSQLGKAGQATAANAQRLLEKWRQENEQTG